MEIRVELSRIIINETSDQQVIVLKELGGERTLPIDRPEDKGDKADETYDA
jgi:hypothetical protein